tara:strand:+ start:777 stop:959 length:183 start_codon:yes stop_codon:yes gene_type:complete
MKTSTIILWSVGLIQLTFLLSLSLTDVVTIDSFLTNTVYYKSSLFMNGFIFGVVINTWIR